MSKKEGLKFTAAQHRRYYEARLQGQAMRQGMNDRLAARCPFHDDRTASLSINIEKGKWYCHGPCRDGGYLIEFEQKFSNCDIHTALERINEIVGSQLRLKIGERPEAEYIYRDEFGRELYRKIRYSGKRFQQVQPARDGKEAIWNLADARRILYNLPQLVTAREVFICEGEKDCDNLNALVPTNGVIATTNFDGGGKWRDEYGPYFTGKRVVIFPDNDATGQAHALRVAQSIHPYAAQVAIVDLPNLGEHGDVTDFLKEHTFEDVITAISKAKRWEPQPAAMFVSPEQFVAAVPDKIDWLVEGVIQRGDNGVIAADPKGSKSVVTIDLAIAMALGKPWLDFYIPHRVKTALISREDNDSTTGRRMRRVVEGRDSNMGDLRDWLYINSRRQTKELMLDNDEQYSDLLFNLKQFRPEFVILDVFNVLHDSEENDQQEMKNILRKVTQLSSEVGCSVMLVHHFRKGGEEDSLTQRLRGSSAIAGWCEWVIGLRLLDRELKVREMEFEYKVCEAPKSLYYRLNDLPSGALQVTRTDYEPPTRKGKLGGK